MSDEEPALAVPEYRAVSALFATTAKEWRNEHPTAKPAFTLKLPGFADPKPALVENIIGDVSDMVEGGAVVLNADARLLLDALVAVAPKNQWPTFQQFRRILREVWG